MTNKQAAQTARQIPFQTKFGLWTDYAGWFTVRDGLQRIVAKQLRHGAHKQEPGRKAHLQQQMGCI